MVLVDTSVWVEHFRVSSPALSRLLSEAQVFTHPMVIGELSLGRLRNRKEILRLLSLLPTTQIAHDDEVLYFIEEQKLYGSGVGWVDVHLLSSALLSDAPLWTVDRRLNKIADGLDLSYPNI